MPVGRGARGLAGTDVGARARDVLDVELLSEMFRQFLCKEAGGRIGRTAGTERYDHAHRPRRIGLRPSEARDGRVRNPAPRPTQKIWAGEFKRSVYK